MAKCASVKRLYPDAQRAVTTIGPDGLELGMSNEKPFAGIVAFSAGGTPEAIFDRYVAEVQALPDLDRPNALLVLDAFAITWHEGQPPNSLLLPSPLGATFVVRQDLGENSLLVFYLTLIEALRRYQPPSLDLLEYVNAAGGVGQHQMTFSGSLGHPAW